MYCIKFPLKTKSSDEARIDKFFIHCCMVYNRVNGILSKEWRRITEECKDDNGKVDYKMRRKIAKEISYNEGGISSDATKEGGKTYSMFSRFGITNIIACICKEDIGNGHSYANLGENNISISSKYQSQIALRLTGAWEKVMKENAVSHKKKCSEWGSMKSNINEKTKHILIDIEKKTLSVKYGKNNYMVIPFVANPSKKEYEAVALSSTIKELGITSEVVRGRKRYYLTVTVDGTPYNKGRKLGEGAIGIDPGVSSVTYYGKTVGQYKMDTDIKKLEEEKAKLLRYLDRSRRATNKDNYTDDGQIKRGIKLNWVKSNRYIVAQNRLREIERSISDKRKREQIDFVNEMLSEGNELHIEKNDVSSWSRRKSGITKGKNGRIKSNKRFGKSLHYAAPAQFVTIAKNKFTALGGTVVEVPSSVAAATATDHTSNFERTKRELKERSVKLSDGTVHDRDAHAAFNLKHCREDGKYDEEGMLSDYGNFCREEQKAWDQLKYQK